MNSCNACKCILWPGGCIDIIQHHVMGLILKLKYMLFLCFTYLCRGELLAVVTACLQSSDNIVVTAALSTATDLVRLYKDNLLQHMHPEDDAQSFVVQLLQCAAAASRPLAVKTKADALLRYVYVLLKN